MAAHGTRSNETLLRYLSAAALAVVTWAALQAMPFYPDWLEWLLAAGMGALTLASPSIASLGFVVVLALPLIAADFVSGVLMLIAGLIATQYLSMGRAGAFVLAAVGVALLPLGGALAAVAVAGYLLGRDRGATVGATMAASVVAIGILLGLPVAGGLLATGGATPGVLSLAAPPADPLLFGWLLEGLKAADVATLFNALATTSTPILVIGQIAVWAVAGAAGSLIRTTRSPWIRLAVVGGIVAALGASHAALNLVLTGPLTIGDAARALAISLPLALAATAAEIWVFPRRRTAGGGLIVPERRDVDDLLRVIASAEDELAARHNTEAVVLITDMKSFSAMTEELGSVESAKVVQRHRDLLLPVIAAHHGKGAPTGGDGLVASFRSPAEAVSAAIAMQEALEGYTGSDRSPHELSVRIGIASGEVVLDAAGVPFLGGALNMAARVMDLADGGRIMITSYVSSAAGLEPGQLHRHGDFKLKNIAEPIPVAEVLWRSSMAPQEIRAA